MKNNKYNNNASKFISLQEEKLHILGFISKKRINNDMIRNLLWF